RRREKPTTPTTRPPARTPCRRRETFSGCSRRNRIWRNRVRSGNAGPKVRGRGGQAITGIALFRDRPDAPAQSPAVTAEGALEPSFPAWGLIWRSLVLTLGVWSVVGAPWA